MRQAARHHAISAVRPSPARAEAPEPDAWIPILDLGVLEAMESQIDPALARELGALELRSLEPAPRREVPRRSGPEAVLPEPAPVVVRPRVEPAREVSEPPRRLARARHRNHRTLHWVLLAAALTVVVAGVPYFLGSPAQRRVTLHVDGASFTRMARADDVAGLLASAGVVVDADDRVTPAPGEALRDGATVRVVRAFPLTVDVDGEVRSVRTTSSAVKGLRRELRIPTTMVAVGAPARLHRGDSVVFRTPFDVTLVNDGIAGTLTSTAGTVGALLTERGIPFVEGDQIEPPLGAPLTDGLAITITHTSAGRVTEDTPVPFEVHEQADSSLSEGKRRTVQSGVEGVDRTTYQLTHAGDVVVGKLAMGTVRVVEPQPQIVAVGTMPASGIVRQSGRATWYATLYQPGTCAHLHVPFGTIVRVVDTDTGASATCRVADRGPEAWTGNVIDLSPDVFEQLRPLSSGVVHVRLEY